MKKTCERWVIISAGKWQAVA